MTDLYEAPEAWVMRQADFVHKCAHELCDERTDAQHAVCPCCDQRAVDELRSCTHCLSEL